MYGGKRLDGSGLRVTSPSRSVISGARPSLRPKRVLCFLPIPFPLFVLIQGDRWSESCEGRPYLFQYSTFIPTCYLHTTSTTRSWILSTVVSPTSGEIAVLNVPPVLSNSFFHGTENAENRRRLGWGPERRIIRPELVHTCGDHPGTEEFSSSAGIIPCPDSLVLYSIYSSTICIL